MRKTILNISSFFTTVEQHTRPPASEDDWEFCYKAHGAQIEGFDSLNLSMETFKGINKGLGSPMKITVSKTTPFAFFYNIKRLIIKTELPHLPD